LVYAEDLISGDLYESHYSFDQLFTGRRVVGLRPGSEPRLVFIDFIQFGEQRSEEIWRRHLVYKILR
jgi:hypothetical protein